MIVLRRVDADPINAERPLTKTKIHTAGAALCLVGLLWEEAKACQEKSWRKKSYAYASWVRWQAAVVQPAGVRRCMSLRCMPREPASTKSTTPPASDQLELVQAKPAHRQ